VVGLDGTPFSFLNDEIESGNLPNIAALASGGVFSRMESEIPTISSVAWASFMTGKNPGEHGIYGFTGRKPGSYELYFPNYSHLKAEPFWDLLSGEGRSCCILNVPSTYPARPLNGILVSGFVAPNLERATYPVEAYEYLRQSGYRIDVDASKGRESLDLLLEDLHETLEKRREAMLHFWESRSWDFFMNVFTGTDRLHHFLWRHYQEKDSTYASEFIRYYRRVDEIIGEFLAGIPEDTAVFMLSDHGFCSIDKEVYLNRFLQQAGFLELRGDRPVTIADIEPSATRAYCMDPGRLYVNLAGREPGGIVSAGDYDAAVEELAEAVASLRDPETGREIIQHVYKRDELYHGPCLEQAPDLVAMPYDGYDLKGAIGRPDVMGRTHLSGMHTFNDAFWLAAREDDAAAEVTSIRQVAEVITGLLS
jgi:predicted AlkP superfamily phosphohydrolase/phosphomutase